MSNQWIKHCCLQSADDEVTRQSSSFWQSATNNCRSSATKNQLIRKESGSAISMIFHEHACAIKARRLSHAIHNAEAGSPVNERCHYKIHQIFAGDINIIYLTHQTGFKHAKFNLHGHHQKSADQNPASIEGRKFGHSTQVRFRPSINSRIKHYNYRKAVHSK